MTIKTVPFFIILILFFQLTVSAQEIFQKENATAAKADEYFAELTKQEKFNGAVLIAIHGRVILKKSYNMSPGVPALRTSVDHRFMIASVAKLFVKYLFLRLEEQGKIKLDDPLRKFIPDFPSGEKITVGHLVNHTSGLPRELADREKLSDVDLEKIVQLAKKEKLLFEPGTETLYSNVGYQTLLFILLKTAPNGYERFLTKELLSRFGMSNTYEYNYRRPSNFASGFINENKKILPADPAELSKFESGRFYSTIGDMYKFRLGLFNARLTSKTITDQMLNKNGEVLHAGAIDGYKSYFYTSIKTGLTYIFLSNYSEIPFVRMTTDIQDLVAGKPYQIPITRKRIAIAVNENILKRYVGVYALKIDRNQKLDLRFENGSLRVRDADGSNTVLYPESETVFFTDPEADDIFDFVFDEKTSTFTLFLTVEGGIRLETIKLN